MIIAKNSIKSLIIFYLALYSVITFATPKPAITLYDEPPKYHANFKHFDYVNPSAPKGGTLRLAGFNGFDSLNPFIVKGSAADNLNLLYDTLTVSSADEPNTAYGLIAETIEKAPDSSWVRFRLRKQAKFNDGVPITAKDVAFTFNLLQTEGHPFYRQYYADVDKVIVENDHQILFTFKVKNNRELPMIIGELQVLPEHYWKDRNFKTDTLTPPLGSGPYQISLVKPNASIHYERVKNWWAKDLPVTKGFYNFDKVTVDYYRDMSVALEAFKANQFDVNLEYSAKSWATGYEGVPLSEGKIIKKEITNHNTANIQGFAFNIRNPMFQDKRVREAISLLFDFEWSNRQLFYNSYKRTSSYFENSEMAAHELPTEKELAILEPFRDQVPEEVFTSVFKPPVSDGTGYIRAQQVKAYQLLQQAGYQLKNGKLVDNNGRQLKFEFLLAQSNLERVLLPFKINLAQLGIEMEIRRVDVSQYINRIRAHDFDMTSYIWGQSNSPGNEQRSYWSSINAETAGSQNVIGVKDPVVDSLVEQLIQANSRESLVLHARALDRVLQWGYYIVWNYYTDTWRVAYWDKFGQPTKAPAYNYGLFTWWAKDASNEHTTQKTPNAPHKGQANTPLTSHPTAGK